MEIRLLNGKTTNLKIKKYKIDKKKKSRSSFQHKIGLQLKEEFPHDIIFEEVRIPNENFVLDFFIPSASIVIECHGRQHYEHVKFFHNTVGDYHAQLDRDMRKRDWCELNGFKLVEIKYDDV